MSNQRKLQTEIDRVMKKVDEGVDLFDEIYEKVYSAEQQSQKEKYEVELKKEIKKLQRLRDQIKSWISGSEVKDKDSLLEYRRLIETKMEAFKVVEKETKTKTFSKEGLARQEKLDPEEQKKLDTIKWIGEVIDQLQTLIDEMDLEVEKLSSGKGKKTNKNQIEDCNQHLTSHKFHMSKLEGIMRLVRNDRISAEVVDEVKEDLEYYVESHEEDDYMMAYDEEGFYEPLGLDDLDVVNVDRVTQANTSSKKKDSMDDATSASSGSKKDKSKKSGSASGMIPLTIGRARSSAAKADRDKGSSGSSNEATPTKLGRSSSNVSEGGHPRGIASVTAAPTPKAPVTAPAQSMAAMLKRESEERQKAQALQAAAAAAAQQQAQQAEQARQQAELLRQRELQKQREQAEAQRLQQEAALRQQQQQQQAQQKAEALKRQREQQLLEQQVAAAQAKDAAAKQKLLQQQQREQQQQAAMQQQAAAQAQQQQQQQNVLNVGLSGLSLGNAVGSNTPAPAAVTSSSQQSSVGNVAPSPAPSVGAPSGSNKDATERYLHALNDSFLQMPTPVDSERRSGGLGGSGYAPRNPYPASPPSYPSSPSPIFDNPLVFEKLGTDALFFIFYYAQGTYQQYLAARELKKQSWRYHKKYMTWFQRHEEPKVTTDDYEQGTYVYFDYETGWCQRIKSDFRFEYSFLEDSLSV
mmetsp:Transcript_3946/g.8350  ORF Transcript_3946/g.8350 Transcript_3946/m.8350 type:complete len:692 (-) Transcript_3946:229-2304(-)|eukprot:CAMPEP_0172543540 /NCGR_PEP_ID=MMETSP1067-20121228/13898_1 /TAXON_ID=265564 ORGANISM="Thalassiosira punctigera, Strain Tpunct2005C2" /NCGR_SAMPLE_ID=MMETSP1067 /ASSEMBLY_ACC=CAM_ASM_000444 /LENGTH=691 /DNA_ID=CAMNT_0013329975 /DNA_START=112 /DNA_END=2187 /DNA_ORIENTATION=-